MRLLIDSQLLIWASDASPRLSLAARDLMADPDNVLYFSTASLWEIAIKYALGRPDFHADPRVLRPGLVANGYLELQVAADHTFSVLDLPRLHGDPFDRMLVAQARREGLTLITTDRLLDTYPGDIRRV